jgi:hemoglobin-like flavoprotein
MLTPAQVNLVQISFEEALSARDDLVTDFYKTLFEKAPSVRGMFSEDMSGQSKKLASMLQLAVRNLNDPAALVGPLHTLGAKHVAYGTQPAHYSVVGEALVESLKNAVGPTWTAEHSEAWNKALSFVSQTMLAGATKATSVEAV